MSNQSFHENPSMRSAYFSMKAGEMAKDMTSFVIVTIDKKGFAQINSGGNLMEICFMEKALQHFSTKMMGGEIK